MESFELLARLADAPPDDPLWNELLRRTRALLTKTLVWQFRSRVRRGQVVIDDVTQEVMTKLIRRNRQGEIRFTGTGDREQAFEAYVRKIGENVVLDQWRRGLNSVPAEVQELWQLEAAAERERERGGPGVHADTEVRRWELWDLIDRTLRGISRDRRDLRLNRKLFRLYFWEGFSILQLTRRRAVPLSTSSIARRLRAMRAALRSGLAGFGPAEALRRTTRGVPPRPAPKRRRRPRRRRRRR